MNKKSRIALCVRAVLCGTLPLMMFDSASVLAREVTFDTGVMKTLGLSSDLNHYFAEAPRFLPGTHSVNVKVNGEDRGMAAVRLIRTACCVLITICLISQASCQSP